MVTGFSKTGTAATAASFRQLGFSAAHEPNGGQMNQLFLDVAEGKKSTVDVVDWLLNTQHANQPVQVWSSFLLADMLTPIFDTFPDVRIIVPIRWTITWAESLYDQAPTAPATFADVTRMQLGLEDYTKLPREEDTPQVRYRLQMIHDYGFPAYSFATMAKYQFAHLKMIIEAVPPDKLLLVEIEHLSDDSVLEKMVKFADPTARPTDVVKRIANVTERDKHAKNKPLGVFRSVNEKYIASIIDAEVCKPLMELFGETRIALRDQIPSWCDTGDKRTQKKNLRRVETSWMSAASVWSHLNSTRESRKLTGATCKYLIASWEFCLGSVW
jgi:hypothetical protein